MQDPHARAADGMINRDLNRNGRMDPYRDPRLSVEARVEDLLARMTLEEKAGLLFHTPAWVSPDGTLDQPEGVTFRPPVAEMVTALHLSHFNVGEVPEPRTLAEWHNRLQALAADTRLGIPVTISSDPRHSFTSARGISVGSGAFSAWPEPIGLAATADPELVWQFADIARQEYLATGIRCALHPMADLATEPRWARISGTFGEDAALASSLIRAYVRGFQGEQLSAQSVACMTKHFPGGGPQKDGEDPHFAYGREQVYPGNNFAYHLRPFEAAFAAGTAAIMPYYGMPVGTELEEVGFAFNKGVITGLLRQRYGFDGVVCSDWELLTPLMIQGEAWQPKSWGVEHLSIPAKARKILEAGVDQFGGGNCPQVVIELVRSGEVPEARIDQSARRILRDKFRLGLFDEPYVDPDVAAATVGQASFRAAGARAQRRSIVLLKNAGGAGGLTLPLRGRPRLYVEGVDPAVALAYGEVAPTIDAADVAVLRLDAPYEPRSGMLERIFHAGSLSYPATETARLLRILERVPTIVDIHLDRPAVIPEIAAHCAGLLGSFGAEDAAVLDVIFGRFAPSGKLPFELPSSIEAVRAQQPDVPCDSADPLFAFGFGLTYGDT